jgi:hypothetical protein
MRDHSSQLPFQLRETIASLGVDALGDAQLEVMIDEVRDGWWRVGVVATSASDVVQDEWTVRVRLAFEPTFHWAPHLSPTDEHVIEQHVFRSPVMIAADGERVVWLIPDVACVDDGPVRTWIDQDAPRNTWTIGRSHTAVDGHVLFKRSPGAVFGRETRVGFYLRCSTRAEEIGNPFRAACAFWWERFGSTLLKRGEPIAGDLRPFVEHTYAWAMDRWPEVWQEFELDGRRVGGPTFIVHVSQSPSYTGPVREREFRSIWNQCWFSSLRSASGLYRWARRAGDARLLDRARMTKELALSFPQNERGLFPSVIGTAMHEVESPRGRERRSAGWHTRFWGNSDRAPGVKHGQAKLAPFHLPDMSWTCLQMLQWHEELERDDRLIAYARRFAEGLLSYQDTDGFAPSWVDVQTLGPRAELRQSPQAAVSASFLFALARSTGEARYREAAMRMIRAVCDRCVMTGQWEDFETYYSCSKWGSESIGQRVPRNARFKQNTLSIFWTAQACIDAADACDDAQEKSRWNALSRRCLDELLLYQAAWQPSYMYVPVLGGFGVMNADAEWNDARQSLFAPFIVACATRFDSTEYAERSDAALRASFSMMFAPENPRSYAQWKLAHSFLSDQDHGFMMENYAHAGRTSPQGIGIGEFTIYDWGSGSAAEAWNRMKDNETR